MNDDLHCEHVAPLLPALADGELDTDRRTAVEAHLVLCSECRTLRAHEDNFTALVRRHLDVPVEAPAALRRLAFVSPPTDSQAWWKRALASPWAPRWAAAAVLALLVAVPLAWLPLQGSGQVEASVEQYRHHDFVPGAPLPPCCTAVAAQVGTALGPPSPGAVVPDLGAAGLAFAAAVQCTYTKAPVHLLVYRDGEGTEYALSITDRMRRRFKLVRARMRDGVLQAEDAVQTASGPFAVTRWLDQSLVYTWVRPAGAAAGDSARTLLLDAAR